ncbi:YesL family protein [Evansella sp. AB-P1]|uniref:YesL family protein n=1 Tax=Evansella sp. AB-P1 TaxID=3037653 RepID=UPI00241E3610|nr:YesL family protein [Evansella sp. AB-P1]MDG5787862.1 YesL family protein [Evansella sp. AB-P1]
MSGFSKRFYQITEWIMRLAYVNFLWILFTLAGLIILGIMPASIAMFSIINQWLNKNTEIPIFKTFLTVYKNQFLKGNILSLITIIIGLIIYVDLQFLGTVDGPLYIILFVVFTLAAILFTIFLIYIVPVYVYYDLKLIDYIKTAIMIGVINLHISITMVLGILGIQYILFIFPSIIPFFSFSLTGLYIMWSATIAFNRPVVKKEMNKKYIRVKKEIN